MKIAFLITHWDNIGGAQIHVRYLARSLVLDGHSVYLLVGGKNPPFIMKDEYGIEVLKIENLDREINPIKDWRSLKELKESLRKIQPDLLTIHSSKAGLLGRLVADSLEVPVIFTAHGWSFTEGIQTGKRIIYIIAEKLGSLLSSKVITVSDYDRKLALSHKIATPLNIQTIHNGVVDVSNELYANPENHPPRLTMIARFQEQKDHATLINALSGLRHLEWELSLIGNGPLLENIKKLVAKNNLDNRVHFLGEREDVEMQLSNSQALLLISKWEGLPLSILEGMRAGLPVIASDVGGVSEVLHNGENGYLIPRNGVDELRNSLEEIITDPILRKTLGDNGRKHYEENFTYELMYKKTFDVYSEAVKSKNQRVEVKFNG
ncbi:glycosyltransferase family 4 protein [Alkalihalobacillus sp. R86527]|uniref:glycosyltransferase family 4 protein n=1 Tax=Alkalihalobacillus sp. R86527 TaxID=3093863 RepID=UPI00366BDF09